MSKKSVWCAFKSRDGFPKKIYFEGDFFTLIFIVWSYFYIYAVKLQDTMYNTLLNAEQVLVVVFIWYLCFNLIFQCIYTCTYFFRPLARLYGVCHIVSYYTFYRPGNHNAINVLNDPSISVLYHNVLFCVSFVYCISRVNIMCVCILTCILY